jgi:hypothetical protein
MARGLSKCHLRSSPSPLIFTSASFAVYAPIHGERHGGTTCHFRG